MSKDNLKSLEEIKEALREVRGYLKDNKEDLTKQGFATGEELDSGLGMLEYLLGDDE